MSTAAPRVRPFEEEALFNPAFLALVLHRVAKEHEQRGGLAMPVVLAYLVPPLALHRATREALPGVATSQMGEWIRSNPLLITTLAERARSLRPLVSSALCMGLRHGALVTDGSNVRAGHLKRRTPGFPSSQDAADCLTAAGFLGRWFAEQPDPVTVLALWGLRP